MRTSGSLKRKAVGLTRIDSRASRRRTKTFPLAWRRRSPGAWGDVKRSRKLPIG